jgi:hypothetical protein
MTIGFLSDRHARIGRASIDWRPVDLLLLLYAMIAGLTGFNAGPSAAARLSEAPRGEIVAPEAATLAPQAAVAVKALAALAAVAIVVPLVAAPDARRRPVRLPAMQRGYARGRRAPERRLE